MYKQQFETATRANRCTSEEKTSNSPGISFAWAGIIIATNNIGRTE